MDELTVKFTACRHVADCNAKLVKGRLLPGKRLAQEQLLMGWFKAN
jgi:hypothetical protein